MASKHKEKSAWLGAAETDLEEASTGSVPTAEKIINDEPKDYTTMLAEFAARGYSLTRSRRQGCGTVSYHVTRWERHRTFASLPDLQGYLHQVTEAAL